MRGVPAVLWEWELFEARLQHYGSVRPTVVSHASGL